MVSKVMLIRIILIVFVLTAILALIGLAALLDPLLDAIDRGEVAPTVLVAGFTGLSIVVMLWLRKRKEV